MFKSLAAGGCAWDYSLAETLKADPFSELPSSISALPADDYSHAVFAQIMRLSQDVNGDLDRLGSGTHPTNKSGYGIRAARVALATAYGQPTNGWVHVRAPRHSEWKSDRSLTHVGRDSPTT